MNNKVADLETNQECLQREIGVNKSKLEMYTNEIHSLTETITLIQAENIPLSRSVTTLHENVARLKKEKAQIRGKCEEFQNSLKLKENELAKEKSKHNKNQLASASLTHNNPNIADLSDPNRPTKLTEAFSELYDNEWTDAFENLKEDDERITVDRLLMMLQKAYGFSVTLTDDASKHMGGNVTSLTLNYNRGSNVQPMHKSASRHAEKRNVDTTEHRDSSETRLEDKSKANSCTEFTEHITSNCDAFGEKYKSIYFKVDSLELKTIFKEDTQHNELTANHGFAGVKSKTDVSNPDAICGQEHQIHAKDTISLYKDTAVQVGSQEEMNVATVSFDFDILSPTEKQTINGIRKRILHALKDQIIPMIAEAVVGEMNLQACADSIITYVKACASICWEMRIHQPPVFLEFLEIDDQTPFNTAIYKHYTKQGLRMDYVVWPAMYLYKGGALLSKGNELYHHQESSN